MSPLRFISSYICWLRLANLAFRSSASRISYWCSSIHSFSCFKLRFLISFCLRCHFSSFCWTLYLCISFLSSILALFCLNYFSDFTKVCSFRNYFWFWSESFRKKAYWRPTAVRRSRDWVLVFMVSCCWYESIVVYPTG